MCSSHYSLQLLLLCMRLLKVLCGGVPHSVFEVPVLAAHEYFFGSADFSANDYQWHSP